MRRVIAALSVAVTAFAVTVSARAAVPQEAPASSALDGAWSGKVKTDSGEMKVRVVIKVEKGKASGTIETPHGDWPIAGGTLKDGVWTLPFTVDGAGDRWMKGTVKGDVFAGEWNNAPMAVGTFELARTK